MLRTLLSGEIIGPDDVDKLKLAMLDGEQRLDVLEELEMECTPVCILENASFNIMCELLGEFIEEAGYDEDYDSLTRIYRVAACVGTYPGGGINRIHGNQMISFKSYFDGGAPWRVEMFWVQTAVNLIRKDMNQWAKIMFIFKEHKIKDVGMFGQMTSSQVRALLVISRIQAMLSSMRSVDLSNEFIVQVLQEISAQFDLNAVGIDITNITTMNPVKPFLQRVLQTSTELFLPALLKRAKAQQKKHRHNRAADGPGTIYSSISLTKQRVDFVEKTHSSPADTEIGYSPLLELIFCTYIHAIQSYQEGLAHKPSAESTDISTLTQQFEHIMLDPAELDAPHDALPREALTLCICGGAIHKWSFLDSARAIESEMSAELRGILNSVALGLDPRSANKPVQLARPKSMMMSGKFSLLRPQSVVYNGNMGAQGVKINPFVRQVNNSVVCSMLCERCYRHLLAAPLSVDADCIQCTSLCPTGNGHYSAMTDQEVRFEEVLNIAQSRDEYVNYHGSADSERSAKSIDFSLFDKNLSVLLKRHHQEEPSPSVSNSNPNSSKHGQRDPHASTHPVHSSSSSHHGSSREKMLDSHGIEGHRIRNSRDLTKILRSNSGISAGSVGSVENSNTSSDSKTEELHLVDKHSDSYLQAMETANVRHAHLEKYHKTRALPPDPPNSPKNLAASPGGVSTPATIQTGLSDLSKGDSSKMSVGSLNTNMNTIKPSTYKAASFEVIPFIVQLWEGITIKIVYSSKPLVEKTRVVYLRGSTERANKLIRERLVPIGTEVTAAHRNYTHTALLDALHSTVLQLCWGRRSVMGTVSFSAEKCLDMDTVKHIKVGTGVWAQCINIGSSTGRTLVLKIEEQAMFTMMLDGITALVATRQKDTHGAESK